MAGGLGSRLGTLTADRPKPMLPLGNKPILETILQNFLDFGFRNFYVSVNYKAEMIQSYFGDGSKWGANIRYLKEAEALGTAGAVGLLPEPPQKPMIVMNGDVLTKINFLQLLDFHAEHEAHATMAVREYDFQVPYGVVKVEQEAIHSIDEKPIQKFFVNGGIYVLEPSVQKMIPRGERLDMPELFRTLHQAGKKTVAFPIREYWLDIGRIDDFERAKGEFSGTFTEGTKG
jgi:NDP-sugar pyrophosphorylase family protein